MLARTVFAAVAISAAAGALAQQYPTRPVTMLVIKKAGVYAD